MKTLTNIAISIHLFQFDCRGACPASVLSDVSQLRKRIFKLRELSERHLPRTCRVARRALCHAAFDSYLGCRRVAARCPLPHLRRRRQHGQRNA